MFKRKKQSSLSKIKKKILIWSSIAISTIFVIVLITTMITNLVVSAATAILAYNGNTTVIYCDGDYTQTTLNLHIWSSKDRLIESNNDGTQIANRAEALAWPLGTSSSKYDYPGGSATNAYKSALKKELNRTSEIDRTDCGYFVSTVVRSAGVDLNYKALDQNGNGYSFHSSIFKNVRSQVTNGSNNIDANKLVPGDIIQYHKDGGDQHTLIFLGNSIYAEAGRGIRYPIIRKFSHGSEKFNSSNVQKATQQVLRVKSGSSSTDSIDSEIAIDFKVSGSKAKISNRYELIKEDIQVGDTFGCLSASLTLDEKNGKFSFQGLLCGVEITLSGTASNGKINGEGIYGSLISSGGLVDIELTGAEARATTPIQKKIAEIACSYSPPPYETKDYCGWCELWVHDVYKRCGITYTMHCCANRSKLTYAKTTGTIPVGAAIYSGGSYKSSYHCDSCGLNCGHVAIYVGNGKVAGSQSIYIQSLESWTKFFGYGGWYLPSF